MLYIGIDLGTSAIKLLLMDEGGTIHKVVSREYPLEFPKPGWSQQNPEDWKNAVLDGLAELTAECDKTQIAGIGCGGQMHGLVILDKQDEVIRPAILWNDGRTEDSLGQRERAGEFLPHCQNHAPQGLYQLHPDGGALPRLF